MPDDPEQQRQMQQQQEFRQNMQSTIQGLNASIGMAYGMTQVGYLGTQAVKYFFKALRFILGKIFSTRNVTYPMKLISKVLFGTDFESNEDKLR